MLCDTVDGAGFQIDGSSGMPTGITNLLSGDSEGHITLSAVQTWQCQGLITEPDLTEECHVPTTTHRRRNISSGLGFVVASWRKFCQPQPLHGSMLRVHHSPAASLDDDSWEPEWCSARFRGGFEAVSGCFRLLFTPNVIYMLVKPALIGMLSLCFGPKS